MYNEPCKWLRPCFTDSLARMSNIWGQVGHLHNFFSGWIVKWETEAGKWGGTETNLNNSRDPLIWKLRQEMSRSPPNDPGARSANWRNGGKKCRLITLAQRPATLAQKLQRCPKIENLSNAPNLSQYFLTRLSLNNNILWTLWPTKLSQICRSSQIVAHNSSEIPR